VRVFFFWEEIGVQTCARVCSDDDIFSFAPCVGAGAGVRAGMQGGVWVGGWMVLVDTHGRGRCESASDGGRSRGGVCVCLPEMGSFARFSCTAPKGPSEDTEKVGGGEGRQQGEKKSEEER